MIEQWKDEIIINEFGSVTDGCDLYVERVCNLLGVPDDAEVIQTVQSMNTVHPRIIATEDTLTGIKGKNAFNTRTYQKLKNYAETYRSKPVVYPDEFQNNLKYSREVLDRAFVLSFLYQNEKESEYVDLLRQQLQGALALYQTLDLNDSTHVLPYGELTVAFSIAYDWCYDSLTVGEKTEIREAIKRLATHSLSFYQYPMKANATQVNNWNAIFSSANIIAGLTMYGEDDSDLWANLVNKAIRSYTLPLSEFTPNGGFPEGTGYWEYQAQYVVYAIAALDSCLGTDFNLSKMPGMESTVFVPIYQHNNEFMAYNYSDSSVYRSVTAFMPWFGAKYGIPEAFSYCDAVNPNGVNYSSWEGVHYDLMIMLWREDTPQDLWKKLPTSYCFKGRQQVMTIRNSWDKNRAFLGFKGGYNQLPHCNLDLGSFIYDWNGIRWFTEVGNEDYSAGGFWDFQSGRWNYYTQRAEGHNTFVVNPDEGPDQNIYATATVDSINANTGVVDVTNAYPDLRKGERTFSLKDDVAVIEDFLYLKKHSIVYWFMHTDAAIEITGSDTAILTKNGSAICVEFDLPEGAELSVMEARPLVIAGASGTTLSNVKKLCVRATGDKALNLVTRIIPQN